MCYAKPGPRCSNHAKKAMENAHKRLQTVDEEIKALEEQRKTLLDEKNDKPIQEIVELDDKLKQLKFYTKYDMQQKYENAKKDFYTTPAGFQHLEQEIEKETDPYKKNKLTELLHASKHIRERQTALKNAEKYRTSNPHEYAADEHNLQQLTEQLKTGYGKKNIYIGKETKRPKKLDEITKLRYETHQKRIDKLVDYFRNSKGEIKYDSGTAEYYDKEKLTPGYKLLGSGSYQNAYLDEVTGDVIKIPAWYDSKDGYSSRGEYMSDSEQYNYSILNVEKLKKHKTEYVETLFYRPTSQPKMNVLVQPYLNPDEYETVDDNKKGDDIISNVERAQMFVPGIWDVHEGNYKVNKKTGKAVLFDCLDVDPYY